VINSVHRYEFELRRLKRWIWIYFWLLIFEGALRKWLLPALSGPLLVIRDPVALMIYYRAYRCGKFSMRKLWPFAFLAVAMALLAAAQLVSGIGTLPIALYGLRSYALHPALLFVMAETLDDADIRKVGRWLLLLSVPMLLLVAAQFNAPSGSWLNAGAGENATQIQSAGGHIRPAGTFSYGIGMQCFVALGAAFLLDAFMRKGRYPAWMLYGALFATIGMIPMLGSRTVLFVLAALALFTVLSALSHGARLVSFTKILVVLLLAGFIAIQLPFFQQGVETMQERWEQASRAEGNVEGVLNKRVLGVFEAGGEAAEAAPLLGKGIGLGSSFAATSTGNEGTFLAGENEWQRVVVEFGPVFGLLFMGARVMLACYIVLQAFRALRGDSVLAWLLVPTVVPLMLVTIMEQTTFLGFMIFGGGLCLAAARQAELSRIDAAYAQRAAWQPTIFAGRRRNPAS
jgi:hypothetical protein